MKPHDPIARAAMLAAQEAILAAEQLRKTTSTDPKAVYASEEEFQERLKEQGINPDATKNPAIRTLNEMFGLWDVKKSNLEDRPKIAAIDMDGTILHNPGSGCSMEKLGDPIPGVKEKLRRLKDLGWTIVVWSVRDERPEILAHLKKHDIPFDYYNWHPWQPKGAGVKILADVYLDDRAIAFTGSLKDFDQILVHKPWWKKKKDD